MSHPFDGIVPAGTTRRSWLRGLFGAVAGLFAWRAVRAAAPPRPGVSPERLRMPKGVEEKKFTTLALGEDRPPGLELFARLLQGGGEQLGARLAEHLLDPLAVGLAPPTGDDDLDDGKALSQSLAQVARVGQASRRQGGDADQVGLLLA